MPSDNRGNYIHWPHSMERPLTSASAANPTVLTTPDAHGLAVGDLIIITGTSESALNSHQYKVATVPTAKTFTLTNTAAGNVSSSGSTGGTWRRMDWGTGARSLGTTTAEQLPARACEMVRLTASSANAGAVYVGPSADVGNAVGSDDEVTGMLLNAGQTTDWFAVTDLSQIWVRASAATQNVTYIWRAAPRS